MRPFCFRAPKSKEIPAKIRTPIDFEAIFRDGNVRIIHMIPQIPPLGTAIYQVDQDGNVKMLNENSRK